MSMIEITAAIEATRGVRGIALGRKSWLLCGSDRGGERAAIMYRLT
jgi:transposase